MRVPKSHSPSLRYLRESAAEPAAVEVRLAGHAGYDTPGTALRSAYTLMA